MAKQCLEVTLVSQNRFSWDPYSHFNNDLSFAPAGHILFNVTNLLAARRLDEPMSHYRLWGLGSCFWFLANRRLCSQQQQSPHSCPLWRLASYIVPESVSVRIDYTNSYDNKRLWMTLTLVHWRLIQCSKCHFLRRKPATTEKAIRDTETLNYKPARNWDLLAIVWVNLGTDPTVPLNCKPILATASGVTLNHSAKLLF